MLLRRRQPSPVLYFYDVLRYIYIFLNLSSSKPSIHINKNKVGFTWLCLQSIFYAANPALCAYLRIHLTTPTNTISQLCRRASSHDVLHSIFVLYFSSFLDLRSQLYEELEHFSELSTTTRFDLTGIVHVDVSPLYLPVNNPSERNSYWFERHLFCFHLEFFRCLSYFICWCFKLILRTPS